MFVRFFLFFAVGLLIAMPQPAIAQSELRLESVVKIWDEAPHNAFTDLVRYRETWVCAFREAPAHTGGVKGSRIRIIISKDGQSWKSAASISDPRGDIRDAKLAETPDGRLMLLTATQFFDTSEQQHQSHTWFSSDLETWEGPHDVGDPDIWAWGIRFHNGTGYSIGYRTMAPRFVRLYRTADGQRFESLVDNLDVASSYPNESVIVFDEQGTAYCLLRCQGPAQLGIAQPPYQDWDWTETGVAVGGPEMIQLPDGRLLGGGRLYDGSVRTSLFWIDPETAKITETLKLPSGGDTSYPGFVLHAGKLYVSYYSSHEGKSSIYLATIDVGEQGPVEQSELLPVEVSNRREPFIDSYLVDAFSGSAELRLNSPVDREIVLRHDRPWEGNTSTYHTVFQDGDKYRMYYRGSHAAGMGSGRIGDHPEFTCYAESEDGIHWTRPELGLYEFNGSSANNIVLADDPATHNFAPFLDRNPDAAPDAKYKAIGRGPGGLYAYQSPDGIHWQRMQDQPVITDGKFDSLNLAFYDTHRKQYLDFHRDMRNGVRDIKTAVSDDFLEWKAPEWLEYPNSRPQQLYTNAVVAYHRAPHILIGLPKRLVPGRNPQRHRASGVSDALLMSSRDGKTFHRWAEAVVRPGLQPSRWVNRNNLPAWGIVETASDFPAGPGELSIYTTGGYYTGDGVTLRRHTWRLDGFASVHAAASGGEMVTVPLKFAAVPNSDRPASGPAEESTASLEFVQDETVEDNGLLAISAATVIEIPDSRSLGNTVTLAATVRDVPPGRRRLFSTYNGNSAVPGELYFDFDSDGNVGNGAAIRFHFDRLHVDVPSAAVGDWSADGKSHHLAAVWDDGRISIYFDGKRVAEGGEPGAGELAFRLGNLQFGEDYRPTSQANEPFLGKVDDLLVLKQALSPEQVQALAENGNSALATDTAKGMLYTMDLGGQGWTDQLNADDRQDAAATKILEPTTLIRGATELVLNLSTSAAGSVKVELQDASGQPIPGYTLAECDSLFGDGIAMPVSWNQNTEVSPLAGRSVRVRFVLQDADLYSMCFQAGGEAARPLRPR